MQKKEQWSSKLGFIMATIGSAVGLGNIWRFPYQAYENGGGAFLLPYFIALFTAGIPFLILEMGFGFKMKSSAPLAFKKIKEKYEWIGWWGIVVSFITTIYYTVIIAWSLGYFLRAFNLGWGSDPENFFFNSFLKASNSVWHPEGIRLSLLFALALIWLTAYFIILKGIKGGIEKANKIFMPLLAALIILFTIRGITLPGSLEGIKAFIIPDFSKITDWNIWVSAYGQIFYTLSLGFGILIAYASYLPDDSDIVSSGIITALANSSFSIITGFGVFGILGYMAMQQGVTINEVATSGIGLAFVVFPKAINLLPAMPNIIGILFFLSLIIAGLSSIISLVEAIVSSLMDRFNLSRKKAVTLITSSCFLLGIPFVTGGGIILLDIVDHFINAYGLLVVGLVEVIIISHYYGIDKIKSIININSSTKLGPTWTLFVKYITPLSLFICLTQNLIQEFSHLYGGYTLSEIIVFGWLTAFMTFILARLITKNRASL